MQAGECLPLNYLHSLLLNYFLHHSSSDLFQKMKTFQLYIFRRVLDSLLINLLCLLISNEGFLEHFINYLHLETINQLWTY